MPQNMTLLCVTILKLSIICYTVLFFWDTRYPIILIKLHFAFYQMFKNKFKPKICMFANQLTGARWLPYNIYMYVTFKYTSYWALSQKFLTTNEAFPLFIYSVLLFVTNSKCYVRKKLELVIVLHECCRWHNSCTFVVSCYNLGHVIVKLDKILLTSNVRSLFLCKV